MLTLADFGRDPRSSESLRGRRNVFSMVCRSVCHLVYLAKMAESIEMTFATRTRVGPGKHLLHIADRFEANTVLCICVHSTHYTAIKFIIV